MLRYLSARPRKGTVLDFPAGDGRTTQELLALGFDVVPADLRPESYAYAEPRCTRADMLQRFPFDDESMDYVLCQEGIEHVETPLSFTRECARVLRPGGQLILTTPNVLHMSARVAYFLVGHRTLHSGLINEHLTLFDRRGDELRHGHAWHWRYHLLRYVLRLSGFKVYKPLRSKYSLFSVLLSIPFYPALRLSHRHAVRIELARQSRRRPDVVDRARATLDEIVDHSLSRGVLWNKKLILVAEKEIPSFLDSDPHWSRASPLERRGTPI